MLSHGRGLFAGRVVIPHQPDVPAAAASPVSMHPRVGSMPDWSASAGKRQSPTPASFPQAPDGCAIDFETAATGFQVSNCTFYRSWGAGIMIYGHDTTSQDLLIADNTFIQAGCTQTGDDRGGISAVCPGGAHPSGKVRFQNGCEARSPDNGFLPRTEWAHRLPCHPPTF